MKIPSSINIPSLLDNSNIGIVLHALDTSILYINPRALDLLGLTENQAIGKDAFNEHWHFLDDNEHPMPIEEYPVNRVIKSQQAIKNLTIGITNGVGEDVTWVLVNAQPNFNHQNQLQEIVISFTDITQIRNLQQQIKTQNERFELAVSGTNDGLWDWDLETNMAYHSERFETMLGYSGTELPDTVDAWSNLIHPDDRDSAFEKVEEYLKSKGELSYENTFRMKTKSGEWKWISGRGKATFDRNGTPKRFLGFNTDVTNEINRTSELEFASKHDPLTLLANRFLLNELLQQEIRSATRQMRKIALLYVDLDGFKEVNDAFGHFAGDELLKVVSQRMLKVCRKEDIVSRLGGDEFVIVLTEFNHLNDILPFCNRLLDTLREEISLPLDTPTTVQISCSVGISIFDPSKQVGSEALIRQADKAMYEAKSLGKNQYVIFDNQRNTTIKEFQFAIERVQKGLEEQEFELHYQPKVNLRNADVIGFEALLRWNQNETLLYPDDFLPGIVNHRDTMLQITQWVFKQACHSLNDWINEGHNWSVSINISHHDLQRPNFVQSILGCIAQYPSISPEMIEIELLESSALGNLQKNRKVLQQLRVHGFRIALDDFGTGFSSLEYLKELPVDIIKIDKSFSMDITSNPRSLSIIEASISLAEAFNCYVIAEGVEGEEHGEFLLRLGCEYAQGYAIAKPLPKKEITTWFKKWSHTDHMQQHWQTVDTIESFFEKTVLKTLIEHRAWILDFKEHIQSKFDKKHNHENAQYERPHAIDLEKNDRLDFLDPIQDYLSQWLNSPSTQKHLAPTNLNALNQAFSKLKAMAEEMNNQSIITLEDWKTFETSHQNIDQTLKSLI
ncbi:EAL domain-containing protein [Thiomicrorhabdus indica]|uniref:sensor domain-containing protein n=1 Tax=Thiomicrorhabdus indica TaxID=2267253 RepID=UPI002AA77EA0|nr:EAL domain-containing protein [Thiomicrorhabdus indica]